MKMNRKYTQIIIIILIAGSAIFFLLGTTNKYDLVSTTTDDQYIKISLSLSPVQSHDGELFISTSVDSYSFHIEAEATRTDLYDYIDYLSVKHTISGYFSYKKTFTSDYMNFNVEIEGTLPNVNGYHTLTVTCGSFLRNTYFSSSTTFLGTSLNNIPQTTTTTVPEVIETTIEKTTVEETTTDQTFDNGETVDQTTNDSFLISLLILFPIIVQIKKIILRRKDNE